MVIAIWKAIAFIVGLMTLAVLIFFLAFFTATILAEITSSIINFFKNNNNE